MDRNGRPEGKPSTRRSVCVLGTSKGRSPHGSRTSWARRLGVPASCAGCGASASSRQQVHQSRGRRYGADSPNRQNTGHPCDEDESVRRARLPGDLWIAENCDERTGTDTARADLAHTGLAAVESSNKGGMSPVHSAPRYLAVLTVCLLSVGLWQVGEG